MSWVRKCLKICKIMLYIKLRAADDFFIFLRNPPPEYAQSASSRVFPCNEINWAGIAETPIRPYKFEFRVSKSSCKTKILKINIFNITLIQYQIFYCLNPTHVIYIITARV